MSDLRKTTLSFEQKGQTKCKGAGREFNEWTNINAGLAVVGEKGRAKRSGADPRAGSRANISAGEPAVKHFDLIFEKNLLDKIGGIMPRFQKRVLLNLFF